MFGWNWVFAKNKEQFNYSSFIMFGQFFDGFSGSLGDDYLEQLFQPSSLISSSRFVLEPSAISFRAFSSSFFSFWLSSSSGRSIALSLRSSSLTASSLCSTSFSWLSVTVTSTLVHLPYRRDAALNNIFCDVRSRGFGEFLYELFVFSDFFVEFCSLFVVVR